MEFQAVIMAGGRGSQMSDLTSGIPKPLLPVGNKPLIWYTVNMLERVGFKDVLIVTLSTITTAVRQAISSLRNINADIIGISEDADWGTLDTLRHIKDKIKTDVLILSCDLLCDIPLHRLADVHRIHDTAVTMLLAPARPIIENVPGVKTKRKHKREREIIGLSPRDSARCRVVFLENEADIEDDQIFLRRSLLKQQPSIHVRTDLTDVHAYIVKRWLLDYIAQNTSKTSFSEDLLPYLVCKQWRKAKKVEMSEPPSLQDPANASLIGPNTDPKDIFSYLGHNIEKQTINDLSLKTKLPNGVRSLQTGHRLSVHAYVYEEGFCMRVNTMPSFVEANRLIAKNIASIAPNISNVPLVHPTVKIEGKTQIMPDSLVAEESEIGTRVSVKRSVIGKYCKIGNYAKVSNCTILDRVVIRDGAVVQSCVICDGVEVGEKATLTECLVGSKQTVQPGTKRSNESIVDSASMMEFD